MVIPDRIKKHEACFLFLANGRQCPEQQQCGERQLCSAVRLHRWEAKALKAKAVRLLRGVAVVAVVGVFAPVYVFSGSKCY